MHNFKLFYPQVYLATVFICYNGLISCPETVPTAATSRAFTAGQTRWPHSAWMHLVRCICALRRVCDYRFPVTAAKMALSDEFHSLQLVNTLSAIANIIYTACVLSRPTRHEKGWYRLKFTHLLSGEHSHETIPSSVCPSFCFWTHG